MRGLSFQTDEAAFLAGYLAAGMTKTGKVGTFGGIKIPTVTIFMKGFEAGVKYYNQQKSANVEVLGWDTAADDGLFTGNFNSTDDGRKFAESLMQEGADIIMPVAGPVGLGSAAVCKETGNCMIIGVDADWYETAPEYKEVVLTSVLKNDRCGRLQHDQGRRGRQVHRRHGDLHHRGWRRGHRPVPRFRQPGFRRAEGRDRGSQGSTDRRLADR